MRILIDTNVLFSALIFPQSKPAQALLYVADNHEIVLCDRNIAELRDILRRKEPDFLPDAEVLLAEKSWSSAKAAGTKKVLKNLKAGKKYQIRVRAFVTIDGKRVNGAWSAVTTKKVK